jgi:predicted Zn-dependent peptidase
MRHIVEEAVLKNGSKGLLIDIPGATVMSFLFQFRAGNRYVQSKDVYETAHIMEHMAFGANEKYRDENAYETDFTKNGAYHNAYTSDFSMVYEAICADFEWDRILDLQRLAICTPKFNERELEAEKGNVRSELTGCLNDHERVLWLRIQQALGEDVYTYNQRLRNISNVTLANIKNHHKRTHTLENMRFIIAGKISDRKKEIIDNLESWSLPHGERFPIPVDNIHSTPAILVRRKEAANLTFGWSLSLPRELNDAEEDAMSVLNHILTGTMSSKIFGAARKRGLVYNMFSDTSSNFYNSSWDFGGQVNYDTTDNLFDIIVKGIKTVMDGKITEDEMEAAKSYALGRYQMGAQTVSQICNFYMSRYFSKDEVKDYNSVPDSIKKISLDSVINTARDFISADTWSLGGVSNGEKEQIEKLQSKLQKLFINNK